ncbi:MAG: YncE family protein [Terriglobales bacterium]
MNLRDVQQLSATVQDANGNVLANQTLTFSSSNTSFVTVSSGGLVCAGVWDAQTVVCQPPSSGPLPAPAANITVSVGSVSATVPVYLHPPINAITVSAASSECQTAGGDTPETNTYTAKAFSNGVDITSLVGPLSWSVSPSSVATVDTTGKCTTDNTCVITAAAPGVAQVYASVAGTTSTPGRFTTCPVQSIALTVKDATDTSVTLDAGKTATVAPVALDTKGKDVTKKAILQFDVAQPVVASGVISSGVVTANAPGTTTLLASCTPPSCNIPIPNSTNLYPVYSNPFVVTVNGTSSTTAYVASSESTSLYPIDSTKSADTAVGAAITLPDKPNSMVVAPNGQRLYLGSAAGLIIVDTATNSVSTVPTLVGKPISVSPDSNVVIISDAATGTLYFYATSNNSVVTHNFGVTATHAAWSPDSYRAYVTSGEKAVVYTQGRSVVPLTTATARDVAFLSQGSFAYLGGGGNNVSAYATCNDAQAAGVATPGIPSLIEPVMDGQRLVAVDVPYLDVITATSDGTAPVNGATGYDPATNACIPPALSNSEAHFDLTAGTFTPNQLLVTSDGNNAFVLPADIPSLIAFDLTSQTPTLVPLGAGITGTTTGGVTLDGKLLFFGLKGANTVAKYDVAAKTITPISVTIAPEFVAVRPK